MKRLFFLIYVCIGVVILFQASRIIATVVEKRLLLYPAQTEVKNTAGQAYRPFDGGDYEIALFSSPLFSVRELNTEIPQTEESETPDSPLLKRYELNGVVILPKDRSIALIRRVRERQSQPYRKGEMIDNLEIVRLLSGEKIQIRTRTQSSCAKSSAEATLKTKYSAKSIRY
jgi:hypothetical protein